MDLVPQKKSEAERVDPTALSAPEVQTGAVNSLGNIAGDSSSSEQPNDSLDIGSAEDAIRNLLNATDNGAQVQQLEPIEEAPLEPVKEGEVRFTLPLGMVTCYATRSCQNVEFPFTTIIIDNAELVEELTAFIKHINGTVEVYEPAVD